MTQPGALVGAQNGPVQAHPPPPRHPAARAAGLALGVLALAAAAPAPAGTGCEQLQPEAVIERLNALREAGGVCGERGAFGPRLALRWHERLQHTAQDHARWIAQRRALDHYGENGRTLGQRAQLAGYAWKRITENLAAGQRDLDTALREWSASPGHCANLFDDRVSEAGLACARDARGLPYWVLVLALPR